MFTRSKKMIIVGALAAVAVVGIGGGALYYALAGGDAPESASIESAVAGLSATQSAGGATTEASDLAGTWVIADGSESFVGYRVQEELAGFGTFTAVGRTSTIEATLEFDGSAITDVQVTADLTTLASDNSMRDGQLKRQGIQTDTYPTATFDLTQPIQLNGVPADGETVSATAVGDFTLHGVTRSVSIPLEGQFTGGYAVVVGSLRINFADYNIEKPTAQRVLGIDDYGVMELQLVFERGTGG